MVFLSLPLCSVQGSHLRLYWRGAETRANFLGGHSYAPAAPVVMSSVRAWKSPFIMSLFILTLLPVLTMSLDHSIAKCELEVEGWGVGESERRKTKRLRD